MQTFMPYPNFESTARCLDYRRCGKQRLEAKQIIEIISGEAKSNAWKNHPAIGLWKKNLLALKLYYDIIVKEWIRRGYKNTMPLYGIEMSSKINFPEWYGDDDFHGRHRAALLFKNYEFYEKFGWVEEPKIDYRWK
jgi:hypothetical protein